MTLMTLTTDGSLQIRGWGVSAALHGVIVGCALLFMAQMRPLPVRETFHWDVSLVQAVAEKPTVAPTEPVRSPLPPARPQQATPPVEPAPQIVTRQVQTTETPMVVQRDPPRIVEQAKPIVQTQAVEQREEVTREQVQPQQVHVAERRVEQPVQEATQHEAVMTAAQPVSTQATVAAVQQSTAPAVIERQVQEAPVTQSAPAQEAVVKSESHVAEAVPHVAEQRTAPVVATSPAPVVTEPPTQVAKAATTGPEPKADHRWLAESLWRRVAELKRYPSSARLHGLEGKVVLKAVIRSDGHLAEVSVQESSGHSVLDAAAMEAVRLACPLHMKHELGKPQIVVNLPIVYRLAN